MLQKKIKKVSDYAMPDSGKENSVQEEDQKKFNLEERLISFAILIIEITESLTSTRAGNHVAGQLLRSGTSPAYNYGEAQASESRVDFIHKMKVSLKELKETRVGLEIISRKPLVSDMQFVVKARKECNELIAIFSKSILTAQKNDSLTKSQKNNPKPLEN